MVFLFVLIVGLAGWIIFLASRITNLENRVNELAVRPAPEAPPNHQPIQQEQELIRPVPLPPPLPPVQQLPAEVPEVSAPPPIAIPRKEPHPAAVHESASLEVAIGRSWLSKLGIISLLVGLSLFLINNLTSHGPWGKAITAFGCSLILLATGWWFERGDRPKALAWAMLGGGWAGIYFTTFAIYGVPQVKLIDSPFIAIVLLVLVALGMVIHSLRYNSQTLTAVAFCAAFAAFEVAPLDFFSAAASIPLLCYLLFLAWKKDWQILASSGIIFVYLSASLNFHGSDSIRYAYFWGQPFIWIYWLLIEAYDLLRYDENRPIFPTNACGLLMATLFTSSWTENMKPDTFIALASAAFLSSAILRYKLQHRSNEGGVEAVSPGGFIVSMVVSAVLTSIGIGIHFHGDMRIFAWAVHAQTIVFAGWQLRNQFLSALGGLLFLPPIMVVLDNPDAKKINYPGAVLAAVLYANRFALKLWQPFSYAASLLACVVIIEATPSAYIPLALTVAAACAGLAARQFALIELLIQSGGFAAASILLAMAAPPQINYWITLAVPAAIYAAAALASQNQPIPRQAAAAAANYFCAFFLHHVLAEPWVAAGWAAQMLLVWAIGVRAQLLAHRLQSIPLALATLVYMLDKAQATQPQNLLRLLVLACFLGLGLMRPLLKDIYTVAIRNAGMLIGVIMLTSLVTDQVSPANYTMAWALEAAGLIALGMPFASRVLRWSGLAVFALCLGRVIFIDLPARDSTGRILTFLALGVMLLGVSWAYTQFGDKIKAYLKEPDSQ